MTFLIAAHDTGLLIFSYFLLEEIGLSLKRNVLHKIKGVLCLVNLLKIKKLRDTPVFDSLTNNKCIKYFMAYLPTLQFT